MSFVKIYRVARDSLLLDPALKDDVIIRGNNSAVISYNRLKGYYTQYPQKCRHVKKLDIIDILLAKDHFHIGTDIFGLFCNKY